MKSRVEDPAFKASHREEVLLRSRIRVNQSGNSYQRKIHILIEVHFK